MHPSPARDKRMNRKPEEGDAAVNDSHHPGDEQQLCLHDF
jgi:MOSC domain-containing protein YiiM